MKHRERNSERGQTAVLVALLMVGLLAATGLAIDGGTAFLERRRMQNAADAAAMAGARDLVMGKVGALEVEDRDILDTVHNYAQVNGVEDPEDNVVAGYVDEDSAVLGDVGGGGIPEGATGISATVRIERSSRFMQVVGLNTVPAQAFSLAQTGPPDLTLGAGGLRPFGLPADVFYDLSIGDEVTLLFTTQCRQEGVCTVEWTTRDGNEARSHRGWLNYNRINVANCSSQGGTNAVVTWMEEGWPGTLNEGDAICSNPGVRAAAMQDRNIPWDQDICIPVYQYFDDRAYYVDSVTKVEIVDARSTANQFSLTIRLKSGECGGGTEAGEPLYNVYAITQWE